ncbi:hypothetical protein [Opitutus terrae]|uniref:Lipoprotein n=1 Tax=Opitutus terrae (strain DSM 11246 / JCM 15787 / PB90-1) TaxID=452637 RepID=B1ZSJ8_OPITP|nr:hypothetical protein [Opitutus terrae]ACB73855.1 hypothetical protein Oter_0565 [Opitutus terrae PB90-1]
MKTAWLLLVSAALMYAGCAAPRATVPVSDRNSFVARLPAETYVASITPSPEGLRSQKALATLGAVKLTPLPPGATPAKPTHSVPPRLPLTWEDGEPLTGTADFLLLIGADGQLQAIYCCDQTNRLVAQGTAATLPQWTFTPAEVQGSPVPMVLHLPIVIVVAPQSRHPQVLDHYSPAPQFGPVGGPLPHGI